MKISSIMQLCLMFTLGNLYFTLQAMFTVYLFHNLFLQAKLNILDRNRLQTSLYVCYFG